MPDLATTAQLVTALATISLVLVVVRQVRIAKTALGRQLNAARDEVELDHDRRKKQATLEFFRNVMIDIQPSRDVITQAYGTDEIPEDESVAFHKAATGAGGEKDDHAMGSAIRTYLNGLEKLAVGANLGVFDEDVLRRLAEYRFVSARSQFRYYLVEAKSKGSSKVYKEFTGMAHAWETPESNIGGPGALDELI